jgi:hypothetical protein
MELPPTYDRKVPHKKEKIYWDALQRSCQPLHLVVPGIARPDTLLAESLQPIADSY